jgi:hypothetical protein
MKTTVEREPAERQYDDICAICGETHSGLDTSGSLYRKVPSVAASRVTVLCPGCYKRYHFGLLSRTECEKAGIAYAERKPSIYSLGRLKQRDYDWFQWGPPLHRHRMRMHADR